MTNNSVCRSSLVAFLKESLGVKNIVPIVVGPSSERDVVFRVYASPSTCCTPDAEVPLWIVERMKQHSDNKVRQVRDWKK